MAGNFYIVPPIEIDHAKKRTPIDCIADGGGNVIIFEGVQPDDTRGLYRHCYGVRGFVWAVHGSFERTYYFAPDYVNGNLREHLEHTIVSLWAVIRSELEAAIREPSAPVYAHIVQDTLRRAARPHVPTQTVTGEES